MNSNPTYPGLATTTDGAGAVVWVETHISEGACAYPITSSTTMGQGYQAEVANGKQNLWGTPLVFIEPESEHSSASAAEGFALAGGRVTNFTSGQGLVLMKEVLFVISGKRLPAVFHIGARALTSQSLNVHCGHDDVMAVADTGWGILFARTNQEVADLALIGRRAAEDSQTPFMVVQDGFLTTHTLQNLHLPEPELMAEYVGDPRTKLADLMDPTDPLMSGVVQNQDSYMKGKVAQRYFYDRVPELLARAMADYSELTGRPYSMVDGYGLEDADYALVILGSAAEMAAATAAKLRSEKGMKVGVLNITSFRPFPARQVVEALKGVKGLAVLERCDIPLAQSNPLTLEVKAAFLDAWNQGVVDRVPRIRSGVYGLGSRDVRPEDFLAVFNHLASPKAKDLFVLGVDHPLALRRGKPLVIEPEGAFAMRGHSVGGYGSVTTNKVIAAVAADLFGLQVQAFPRYGGEKKGLPTNYFLTLAPEHIPLHCELERVDFVPLNDVNAFNLANPLHGLVEGGLIFLQSPHTDPARVWADIPPRARHRIGELQARVLYLDTVKIAREVASRPDLEQRMQGIVLLGIFLKATPFARQQGLDEAALMRGVEASLTKYFGKYGSKVVQANLAAVRRGYSEVRELPTEVMGAEPALEEVAA